MSHVESCKHARKFSETPKPHSQNVSFCQLPAESRNLPRLVLQDMTVVKHRVRSDHGVELLLSETCGDKRSAWVSEGSVQKALRDEYFNQAGQARRKQRKKSHAPTGPTAEGESWPTLLIPESAPEDLQAVTCATRKEAGSDALLAKTAGVLCVCLSSGIIVLMQEIYGSESLPQRYFCLAAAKAVVPEAVLLVHDDSCHMYKYCLKRKEAGWAFAKRCLWVGLSCGLFPRKGYESVSLHVRVRGWRNF